MIRALISQSRGIAVFDDETGYGLMDVRTPDSPQYVHNQVAIRALLESTDLESLEVADLKALRTHLQMRRRRQEVLHAILILLDAERPNELRAKAATVLRQKIPEDVWEWVEGVLMSTPLPETADPRTARTWETSCNTFLAEIEQFQRKIRTLETAWHALPQGLFSRETRDQVRAKVVRQGVFRSIVRGKAPSLYSPFESALASYSSTLERTPATDESPSPSPHREKWSGIVDIHHIWDISIWTSAWFAGEWPKLESTLACKFASKWSSHFITVKPLQPFRRETLERMFDSWEAVRHHSTLASSVDLIWDLAFSDKDQAQAHWHIASTAPKGKGLSHVHHIRKLAHLGIISAIGEEYSERGLQQSLLALFDARDRNGLEVATQKSSPREAARWKTFAHCAHHALVDSTPIHYGYMPHEKIEQDVLDLATQDIARWIHPMTDVIAIFALDRVFQQDGGVLHFMPNSTQSTAGLPQQTVVLANFSSRRSHVFSGNFAWILTRLGQRLAADLKSGLPRKRCGWTTLTELGRDLGRGPDYVDEGIDALRHQAAGAGFASATLQREGDEVRLNPELAAPSMDISMPPRPL